METNNPWSDDFKQALIKKAAEIEAQRKRDGITGQENYHFSYTPFSDLNRHVYSNGYGGVGYDPPIKEIFQPVLETVLEIKPSFWKRFLNALKLRIKEG
jgi:hypothetical protein